MNKNYLYGWVFVFNPYTDLWNAARREDYHMLFSGTNGQEDRVLRSKNIKALTELIAKTDGEVELINELVK